MKTSLIIIWFDRTLKRYREKKLNIDVVDWFFFFDLRNFRKIWFCIKETKKINKTKSFHSNFALIRMKSQQFQSYKILMLEISSLWTEKNLVNLLLSIFVKMITLYITILISYTLVVNASFGSRHSSSIPETDTIREAFVLIIWICNEIFKKMFHGKRWWFGLMFSFSQIKRKNKQLLKWSPVLQQ